MAEPANIFTFTVNYEGNRTVLHVPKDLKIGEAVQKAADNFKIIPQQRHELTFLYHGLYVTHDMTVGVSKKKK